MTFGNNVNTMPKIPDTFCPAKWDEIYINLDYNFVYSCCKATPVTVNSNISETLKNQKTNLLSGIMDPSCNYCWDIEEKGHTSRRARYLKKFNEDGNIEEYLNDKSPSLVEINLGNECNFQCMYCNPKFSSQWYADVLKKPYALFNSKFNYSIPIKEKVSKDDKFNLVKDYSINAKRIDLIGGEPFLSKRFFELLELISSKEISVTTNLSCSKEQLDKFFQICKKFDRVEFHFSLDATGNIAEFARQGLNFSNFDSNLKYTLDNAPDNFYFQIIQIIS